MKTQHKIRSYGEGSVYQRKDGRWLYSFKQPSVESTTFDRYESIYLNHLEPVFGDRQIAAIRGIEIQNFLVEKSAVYSFKYVKSMRILLSELFAYAHTFATRSLRAGVPISVVSIRQIFFYWIFHIIFDLSFLYPNSILAAASNCFLSSVSS